MKTKDSNQKPLLHAEVDQPGLGRLRESMTNHPSPKEPPGETSIFTKLRQDTIAALTCAINGVPDGMACGVLAGVNPIYGLYANVFGPVVGGALSSTQLMLISTTSASALAVGQMLSHVPVDARAAALFSIVILAGFFQVLFGILKMGRLIRFVSFSVMSGLLTGIAVLLILSQLPTVLGYPVTGSSTLSKTMNLLAHVDQTEPRSLAIAAISFVLGISLSKTKLHNLSSLVLILIPSVLLAFLSWNDIELVGDRGNISQWFPGIFWPSPSIFLSFETITASLALAIIILIQGAGVSQSVPNPDDSQRSGSRDFVAEGASNMITGFLHGVPVGGSLNETALNVISGARSRWAGIFSGLWMAMIVFGFPGLVAQVAMPSLGALLILAGLHNIRVSNLLLIWDTGWASVIACMATFISILLLPIQLAVGIGVLLSAGLYLYRSSSDLSVVQLVERPDGKIEERRPSSHLPDHQVTVLDVYGPLFYAGARTLERLLPSPEGSHNPVVILRLRGRSRLDATLIGMLSEYARRLETAGGRFYLSGIDEHIHTHLRQSAKFGLSGPIYAYEATPILGQSTRRALGNAQAWLLNNKA